MCLCWSADVKNVVRFSGAHLFIPGSVLNTQSNLTNKVGHVNVFRLFVCLFIIKINKNEQYARIMCWAVHDVGSGCYFDMFTNKVGECARFGTRPLARNQLHLLRVSRNDVLQHKPTFRKCCPSKYLSAMRASGMCECEEMLTCVRAVRMGRLYAAFKSLSESLRNSLKDRLRRLERDPPPPPPCNIHMQTLFIIK